MKNIKFLSLTNLGFAFTIVAAFAIAIASSCNSKPPKNSRAVQAQKGRLHFQKHCAICHGEDGTGLVIDTFDIQPADLTMIRGNRKDQEFPILEIANIIDGRKMSKAHGKRDMPYWGEVFATDENMSEGQIKGKLGELIAYLMSIQR